MNDDPSNEYGDADDLVWDRAIAARLAKLRTVPVDIATLDQAVRARVAVPDARRRLSFTIRPLRAMAAGAVLAVGVAVAVLLTASGGPALADAAQMAQVHEDIVSGRVPVMHVDSIAAANRMLDARSPGGPTLPQVPDAHVMACCMKSVHDKRMACVLLKDEDEPVTLAVASASDMKLAPAPVTSRNGIDYRVQQVGKLSMVMTERNGKWLCLIGRVPAGRLMDLAAQVRF